MVLASVVLPRARVTRLSRPSVLCADSASDSAVECFGGVWASRRLWSATCAVSALACLAHSHALQRHVSVPVPAAAAGPHDTEKNTYVR